MLLPVSCFNNRDDNRNTSEKQLEEFISQQTDDRIESVTRFEVIDHTKDGEGRVLVKYDVKVELKYQDDGRTLKVFLGDRNGSVL